MSNDVSITSDDKIIIVADDNQSIYIESQETRSIIVSNQGVQGVAGNGAVWGDIGGALSDQIDLQSALDAKLSTEDSNIIDLANSTDATYSYTSGNLTGVSYVDSSQVTGNSKSLSYVSGLLSTIIQIFTYNSQVWTVTTTLTYTTGILTGKTLTVNKV